MPPFSTPPGRPRRRRSRRGFLLVDAVLDIVLGSLLIVNCLSLMMVASSSMNASQQTTLAYNAARQQIENVRSFRAAPLPDRTDAPLIAPMSQLALLNDGRGALTVQPYRGAVKQVTVRLNWRSGAGGPRRSLSLSTLVAPGGVTP